VLGKRGGGEKGKEKGREWSGKKGREEETQEK